MTGSTFWGDRACSCLLVPPHPYPIMNVAALSCEYIRQAEMQSLSRAWYWEIFQQWMHFCSWGTQPREKQLAQGKQVLLLYRGWNVDVGSVKGASLVSMLTACARSWHVCFGNMTWNWFVLAETGWEISGSCSLFLFPPSLLMVLNYWRDGSMQLSEESFSPTIKTSSMAHWIHMEGVPEIPKRWHCSLHVKLYYTSNDTLGWDICKIWTERMEKKKPNFVDTSKCSNQGNKKVTQRKKQWPGCLVLYTQSILLLEDERSIVIKLDCYMQKNELLGITLNIFGGLKQSEISFWGAKRNEIWLWKTLSRSLSIMLINSKDK